ncbi:hypothetical protein C5N14_29305 [Micromonospora sp. MW-13]|nr:hypothetical protein C5N14_29305 [Micromonospora sp. MW-13]
MTHRPLQGHLVPEAGLLGGTGGEPERADRVVVVAELVTDQQSHVLGRLAGVEGAGVDDPAGHRGGGHARRGRALQQTLQTDRGRVGRWCGPVGRVVRLPVVPFGEPALEFVYLVGEHLVIPVAAHPTGAGGVVGLEPRRLHRGQAGVAVVRAVLVRDRDETRLGADPDQIRPPLHLEVVLEPLGVVEGGAVAGRRGPVRAGGDPAGGRRVLLRADVRLPDRRAVGHPRVDVGPPPAARLGGRGGERELGVPAGAGGGELADDLQRVQLDVHPHGDPVVGRAGDEEVRAEQVSAVVQPFREVVVDVEAGQQSVERHAAPVQRGVGLRAEHVAHEVPGGRVEVVDQSAADVGVAGQRRQRAQVQLRRPGDGGGLGQPPGHLEVDPPLVLTGQHRLHRREGDPVGETGGRAVQRPVRRVVQTRHHVVHQVARLPAVHLHPAELHGQADVVFGFVVPRPVVDGAFPDDLRGTLDAAPCARRERQRPGGGHRDAVDREADPGRREVPAQRLPDDASGRAVGVLVVLDAVVGPPAGVPRSAAQGARDLQLEHLDRHRVALVDQVERHAVVAVQHVGEHDVGALAGERGLERFEATGQRADHRLVGRDHQHAPAVPRPRPVVVAGPEQPGPAGVHQFPNGVQHGRGGARPAVRRGRPGEQHQLVDARVAQRPVTGPGQVGRQGQRAERVDVRVQGDSEFGGELRAAARVEHRAALGQVHVPVGERQRPRLDPVLDQVRAEVGQPGDGAAVGAVGQLATPPAEQPRHGVAAEHQLTAGPPAHRVDQLHIADRQFPGRVLRQGLRLRQDKQHRAAPQVGAGWHVDPADDEPDLRTDAGTDVDVEFRLEGVPPAEGQFEHLQAADALGLRRLALADPHARRLAEADVQRAELVLEADVGQVERLRERPVGDVDGLGQVQLDQTGDVLVRGGTDEPRPPDPGHLDRERGVGVRPEAGLDQGGRAVLAEHGLLEPRLEGDVVGQAGHRPGHRPAGQGQVPWQLVLRRGAQAVRVDEVHDALVERRRCGVAGGHLAEGGRVGVELQQRGVHVGGDQLRRDDRGGPVADPDYVAQVVRRVDEHHPAAVLLQLRPVDHPGHPLGGADVAAHRPAEESDGPELLDARRQRGVHPALHRPALVAARALAGDAERHPEGDRAHLVAEPFEVHRVAVRVHVRGDPGDRVEGHLGGTHHRVAPTVQGEGHARLRGGRVRVVDERGAVLGERVEVRLQAVAAHHLVEQVQVVDRGVGVAVDDLVVGVPRPVDHPAQQRPFLDGRTGIRGRRPALLPVRPRPVPVRRKEPLTGQHLHETGPEPPHRRLVDPRQGLTQQTPPLDDVPGQQVAAGVLRVHAGVAQPRPPLVVRHRPRSSACGHHRQVTVRQTGDGIGGEGVRVDAEPVVEGVRLGHPEHRRPVHHRRRMRPLARAAGGGHLGVPLEGHLVADRLTGVPADHDVQRRHRDATTVVAGPAHPCTGGETELGVLLVRLWIVETPGQGQVHRATEGQPGGLPEAELAALPHDAGTHLLDVGLVAAGAHPRGAAAEAHLHGAAETTAVHPDAGRRVPVVVQREREAPGQRAGVAVRLRRPPVVHRLVEMRLQVPQLALQLVAHRAFDGHVEAVGAQPVDDEVVQLVETGDVAGGEELRHPRQVVPQVLGQVGDHLLAGALQQVVGDRHHQPGGLLPVRRLRHLHRLPRLRVAACLDQPPRLVRVERRIRAGVEHPALLRVDEVGGLLVDLVEGGVEAGPPVGHRAERHVDVEITPQPHRPRGGAVGLAVRTGLEDTLGELVGVETAVLARPALGVVQRRTGRLRVERAGRVRHQLRVLRPQAGPHLDATQREQVPVRGDQLRVVVEQPLTQLFPLVVPHGHAPTGHLRAQPLLDTVDVRQVGLGIAERQRPPVRGGRPRRSRRGRPAGIGCGRSGAGRVTEDPDIPVGLRNTGEQPGGRVGHLARDGTTPGLDHHGHPARGGRQGVGGQRVRAGAVLREQDDPGVLPDRPTPVHLEPTGGSRSQVQRPRLPGRCRTQRHPPGVRGGREGLLPPGVDRDQLVGTGRLPAHHGDRQHQFQPPAEPLPQQLRHPGSVHRTGRRARGAGGQRRDEHLERAGTRRKPSMDGLHDGDRVADRLVHHQPGPVRAGQVGPVQGRGAGRRPWAGVGEHPTRNVAQLDAGRQAGHLRRDESASVQPHPGGDQVRRRRGRHAPEDPTDPVAYPLGQRGRPPVQEHRRLGQPTTGVRQQPPRPVQLGRRPDPQVATAVPDHPAVAEPVHAGRLLGQAVRGGPARCAGDLGQEEVPLGPPAEEGHLTVGVQRHDLRAGRRPVPQRRPGHRQHGQGLRSQCLRGDLQRPSHGDRLVLRPVQDGHGGVLRPHPGQRGAETVRVEHRGVQQDGRAGAGRGQHPRADRAGCGVPVVQQHTAHRALEPQVLRQPFSHHDQRRVRGRGQRNDLLLTVVGGRGRRLRGRRELLRGYGRRLDRRRGFRHERVEVDARSFRVGGRLGQVDRGAPGRAVPAHRPHPARGDLGNLHPGIGRVRQQRCQELAGRAARQVRPVVHGRLHRGQFPGVELAIGVGQHLEQVTAGVRRIGPRLVETCPRGVRVQATGVHELTDAPQRLVGAQRRHVPRVLRLEGEPLRGHVRRQPPRVLRQIVRHVVPQQLGDPTELGPLRYSGTNRFGDSGPHPGRIGEELPQVRRQPRVQRGADQGRFGGDERGQQVATVAGHAERDQSRPGLDCGSHVRGSRIADLVEFPLGEPRLVEMIVTDGPGRPEQIIRRTIVRHPGEMLQLMPVSAGRKIRKPVQLVDPTRRTVLADPDILTVLQVTAVRAEPNLRLRGRIEHHPHRRRPTLQPQPLVGLHHPLLDSTQRAQNGLRGHVRVGLQPKTEHHRPRLTMHPMIDVDPYPRVLPRRLHPERTLRPRRLHKPQRLRALEREPIGMHPRHLVPAGQTFHAAIRHTPTTVNLLHRRLHPSRPSGRRQGLHAHTSRERALPRTPLERGRAARQPAPGARTLLEWARRPFRHGWAFAAVGRLPLRLELVEPLTRQVRVDEPVDVSGLVGQRCLDHGDDARDDVRLLQPEKSADPQGDFRPRREIHLLPVQRPARVVIAERERQRVGRAPVLLHDEIDGYFVEERRWLGRFPQRHRTQPLDVVGGGGRRGQLQVQGRSGAVPSGRCFQDRQGSTIHAVPEPETPLPQFGGDDRRKSVGHLDRWERDSLAAEGDVKCSAFAHRRRDVVEVAESPPVDGLPHRAGCRAPQFGQLAVGEPAGDLLVGETLGAAGRGVRDSGDTDTLAVNLSEIDSDPVARDGDSIGISEDRVVPVKPEPKSWTTCGVLDEDGDGERVLQVPTVLAFPRALLAEGVDVSAVFFEYVDVPLGGVGALTDSREVPVEGVPQERPVADRRVLFRRFDFGVQHLERLVEHSVQSAQFGEGCG